LIKDWGFRLRNRILEIPKNNRSPFFGVDPEKDIPRRIKASLKRLAVVALNGSTNDFLFGLNCRNLFALSTLEEMVAGPGFETGTELFSYPRGKVAAATAQSTRNEVQFGKLPDPRFQKGDFVFVTRTRQAPIEIPLPDTVPLFGALSIKSPVAGTVSLNGQGAFSIDPARGLEWKSLAVGRYEVKVTSERGEAFTEAVFVREGRSTGLTARFSRDVTRDPRPVDVRVDNGLAMPLVYCPPGTFTMGSPSSEADRISDRENQVRVTISKGYLLGKYEVTQKEWESVMGSNPSKFKGARLPVEQVSWEEVSEFCQKFTEQERRAGRLGANEAYRLPTEAEWEYGCRAGTTSSFSYGSSLSSREANFDGDFPYGGASKGVDLGKTTDVGSYGGNAWGLYDMHGNVGEWCQDWYGQSLSGGADPSGASTGEHRVDRVVRGCCWGLYARYCRSAFRGRGTPSDRHSNLGFRVARVPIH